MSELLNWYVDHPWLTILLFYLSLFPLAIVCGTLFEIVKLFRSKP